jgi:hypothetical protein
MNKTLDDKSNLFSQLGQMQTIKMFELVEDGIEGFDILARSAIIQATIGKATGPARVVTDRCIDSRGAEAATLRQVKAG